MNKDLKKRHRGGRGTCKHHTPTLKEKVRGEQHTNTHSREKQSGHPDESEKCGLNLSPLITPPMHKRAVACITGPCAESTRSLQHNRGLALWQRWIEVRPVACSWEKALSCRALEGPRFIAGTGQREREGRCQQLSSLGTGGSEASMHSTPPGVVIQH